MVFVTVGRSEATATPGLALSPNSSTKANIGMRAPNPLMLLVLSCCCGQLLLLYKQKLSWIRDLAGRCIDLDHDAETRTWSDASRTWLLACLSIRRERCVSGFNLSSYHSLHSSPIAFRTTKTHITMERSSRSPPRPPSRVDGQGRGPGQRGKKRARSASRSSRSRRSKSRAGPRQRTDTTQDASQATQSEQRSHEIALQMSSAPRAMQIDQPLQSDNNAEARSQLRAIRPLLPPSHRNILPPNNSITKNQTFRRSSRPLEDDSGYRGRMRASDPPTPSNQSSRMSVSDPSIPSNQSSSPDENGHRGRDLRPRLPGIVRTSSQGQEVLHKPRHVRDAKSLRCRSLVSRQSHRVARSTGPQHRLPMISAPDANTSLPSFMSYGPLRSEPNASLLEHSAMQGTLPIIHAHLEPSSAELAAELDRMSIDIAPSRPRTPSPSSAAPPAIRGSRATSREAQLYGMDAMGVFSMGNNPDSPSFQQERRDSSSDRRSGDSIRERSRDRSRDRSGDRGNNHTGM